MKNNNPSPHNPDEVSVRYATKHKCFESELALVGNRCEPATGRLHSFGVNYTGDLNALSEVARSQGGLVFRDVNNDGFAVMVLPVNVPAQQVEDHIRTHDLSVALLRVFAFGPHG